MTSNNVDLSMLWVNNLKFYTLQELKDQVEETRQLLIENFSIALKVDVARLNDNIKQLHHPWLHNILEFCYFHLLYAIAKEHELTITQQNFVFQLKTKVLAIIEIAERLNIKLSPYQVNDFTNNLKCYNSESHFYFVLLSLSRIIDEVEYAK